MVSVYGLDMPVSVDDLVVSACGVAATLSLSQVRATPRALGSRGAREGLRGEECHSYQAEVEVGTVTVRNKL